MLADEYMVKAEGWSQFEQAENDSPADERLELSHKIAKLFNSKPGKEVLDIMVRQYLLSDIVQAHSTQFGAGIKQGQANVIKNILAHIEISNNTK